MAYDLAMDINTHDLIIDNRDLVIIDNAERVAQQIKITLCFWKSEWFLDVADGTPYLEYILVKNPNLAHIRQVLSDRIRSVEGVVGLPSLNVDYNATARTLEVEYTANTDYGLLTKKEVLGYGD